MRKTALATFDADAVAERRLAAFAVRRRHVCTVRPAHADHACGTELELLAGGLHAVPAERRAEAERLALREEVGGALQLGAGFFQFCPCASNVVHR